MTLPSLTAADAAQQAVRDLDDGLIAGELPTDRADWNDLFVRAIRAHKDQFRGSKDLEKLLRIASELLYGKQIHWALELVQNAEDAGATQMAILVSPDRIAVWNDGAPFDAHDVWAICSAGHSIKKNKIGFFGIGFKSVYTISDAPEIYSGPYGLRIEGKLYPTPLRPRVRRKGAWVVLPLKKSRLGRIDSILASLASPEFAQVLLTLRSLRHIRVFDLTQRGLSGRVRRQAVVGRAEPQMDQCRLTRSWDPDDQVVWRRYFYETEPVPPDISREERSVEPGDRSVVLVAYPVDGSEIALRLHCYLPTAVASQLRWLVQADFEPSASREDIRDSPWNDWLMVQAGHALASAIVAVSKDVGSALWDRIPLGAEVLDARQQNAYRTLIADLVNEAFIRTRRGMRKPGLATWGRYPGVSRAIREEDLRHAVQKDASYIVDSVLGPIPEDSESRAETVLRSLGADFIGPEHLSRVFELSDDVFYQSGRDASWWLTALSVLARYGKDDDRVAVARTRCLPIRGGTRTQPSPTVDADGYLVAFSRSDSAADIEAYLGPSQVLLLDEFLGAPQTRKRVRGVDAEEMRADIREMVEEEPFGVAREAGPYHVVANLIVPRLEALSTQPSLTERQVDQVWRAIEYLRQKWPSYVSEYKRWRNARATDEAIAADVGQRIRVAATIQDRSQASIVLRRPHEAYMPSEILGWDGLDVALAGVRGIAFVDPVHVRPLRVHRQGRAGRTRGTILDPLAFLRLLGVPIGPILTAGVRVQSRPSDYPWVDWSTIPSGARNRVGLASDSDSPDIARLGVLWPSYSNRSRARRGEALLRAIEADWDRLAPLSRARAEYFYSSWTPYRDAPASWIGRLRQVEWLVSGAGVLRRPIDLVVDTLENRLALGGSKEELLSWEIRRPEAAAALGVASRPGIDRVVETLATARGAEQQLSDDSVRATSKACYATLGDHLRETVAGSVTARSTRDRIAARMRGHGKRGLIFAPPPDGVAGERWWGPSRVVHSDVTRWVGPYLGQLAGRYPRGAPLWEALGIKRDLTVELACELIARDLNEDGDAARVSEYYGRLVSFLEISARPGAFPTSVPALTTEGWRPPTEAWWTSRPWLRLALDGLPWWSPGARDPSALRNAASLLGIREVLPRKDGGVMTERWDVGSAGGIEIELEAAWRLALDTWPHVIREDADSALWQAIEVLERQLGGLRPLVAQQIRITVAMDDGKSARRGSATPTVALWLQRQALVAIDSDDLFGQEAASEIASLAPTNQRLWGQQLALLLSNALHDPDALQEVAAHFAVRRYEHREFTYDNNDADEAAVEPLPELPRNRGKKRAKDDVPAEDLVPLADPALFGLSKTVRIDPNAPVSRRDQTNLKPPKLDEDEEDTDKKQKPPPPGKRYSNTQIEAAARPFVEEFELSNRGTTIVRQGSGVGADYRASDGRYIEVKAFSGDAPDNFDLESTEWRAAQKMDIGQRYWVYVVEHLRDGSPPTVTAVFNPVVDEATQKEPTGKLRVRGWRSSKLQDFGVWKARDEPPH